MSDLWVKNICAAEACDLKYLPQNTVMVSIKEEYGPLHDLQIKNDVLVVRFSDITTRQEIKGQMYHPISQETALKMLDFIALNKDKNFLVHCFAGVSRSSAVALFINNRYGHSLRPHFWALSEPNPFVLGKLIVESKRI
jgi:predicted protein tyrosine phosphatase